MSWEEEQERWETGTDWSSHASSGGDTWQEADSAVGSWAQRSHRAGWGSHSWGSWWDDAKRARYQGGNRGVAQGSITDRDGGRAPERTRGKDPNSAWHTALHKAIREGWESEYREKYPRPTWYDIALYKAQKAGPAELAEFQSKFPEGRPKY